MFVAPPDAGAHVIRPEWLFEVANRLQPLVVPSASATEDIQSEANKVFDVLSPESALEHQITASFRHRLQSDDTTRRAQEPAPPASGLEIQPELTKVNAAVERVHVLLGQDFAAKWTIERLARRVGSNRTDLEAGFRRRYACTVHQYLTSCRVEAAKELLRSTAWRIEEVAKAVGWRSKVSFYRHFRQAVSLTPDEYRRRWSPTPATAAVWDLVRRV